MGLSGVCGAYTCVSIYLWKFLPVNINIHFPHSTHPPLSLSLSHSLFLYIYIYGEVGGFDKSDKMRKLSRIVNKSDTDNEFSKI